MMADELAPPDQPQQTPMAQYLYQGLMARGFNAAQAAALVGNMKQESEWNPSAPNPKEGAFGLIQWREDRKQALANFAQATGRSPSDPDAQMDFIVHEMQGSEAGNSAAFLRATDVGSANQALRSYIRYGDNSEGARLQYAERIAGGNFSSAPVSSMQANASSSGTLLPMNQTAPPKDFSSLFGDAISDTAQKQQEQTKAAEAQPATKGGPPIGGAIGSAAPLGVAPAQLTAQPAPGKMDYYLALLKRGGGANG